MHQKFLKVHTHFFAWHYTWYEQALVIVLLLLVFTMPASAAMRLQQRSLYMNNVEAGAMTSYTVSFRYMSPQPIGSVEMLFCIDPIPYHACVTPPGLDASGAVLANQAGETGYTILSKNTNRIVLSRTPTLSAPTASAYTFDGIKNPTNSDMSFSIRLKTLSGTAGTGPQIDFGSVKGQITTGIDIVTQVPPMLIFCAAEEVEENCTSTNDNYYTDMGKLDPNSTLVAQSQMAVGTNASGGFAITTNGTPPSAGTNTIDALATPTESLPGVDQFGINLVENDAPSIGKNPQGDWANAVASPDYSVPNMYKFVPGDVIAYSPNVSLMKKFTVSYILNSSPSLRAGVYSTTVTYIASGRF